MLRNRNVSVAVSVVIGAAVAIGLLTLSGQSANARAKTLMRETVQESNIELAGVYNDELLARLPGGKPDPREQELAKDRRARVQRMYRQGLVQSPEDYFRAATVLQHSGAEEEVLLAHDLAVTAMALGDARAAFVAASTQDRFMVKLGRPQRFGTLPEAGGKSALTVAHRAAMGVIVEPRSFSKDLSPSPRSAAGVTPAMALQPIAQ